MGAGQKTKADTVEHLGRSLIQHGPLNDRIYLMKLDRADLPGLVDRLARLAREQGYGKIFAKVPASAGETFAAAGYEVEASIPGFFSGEEDGLFVARFLDPARRERPLFDRIGQVLVACGRRWTDRARHPLPGSLELWDLDPLHAPQISRVYAQVFESYPFPIEDPDYIRQAMRQDVVFYGVFDEGELVAVSSAEVARGDANAEMTDFATLPAQRGQRLACSLLERMEQDMRGRGLRTLYTIARATSFGMNITFARLGYQLGGTLVNNTNIGGGLESMNVWFRRLGEPDALPDDKD